MKFIPHIFFLCIALSVLGQDHTCADAKKMHFTANKTTVIDDNHIALEGKYDAHYYHLNLAVERDTTYISGDVTIEATAIAPIDTFALELHPNLIVDSALVNGHPMVVARNGNSLDLLLNQSIATSSNITVRVYYHGTPPNNGSSAIGNGFNNGVSVWGSHITWNLSEPYSAYEWWPCKQALQDKADSSEVDITTDTRNLASSNGLLQSTTYLPNGKKRVVWQSHYPIDYYLISVTVGQLQEYNFYAHPDGADSFLVQNYIYTRADFLPTFKPAIDSTADLLKLFSKLYGLYPFHAEKYGHSMAPLGGGMEHQTMTTLSYMKFTLIAHEMTHQWFGDNITCATWSDIWLNEGFASYGEYLAEEFLKPGNEAAYLQQYHDLAMSVPDGSVYCTDTSDVNRIFDYRLSYRKPGAVIHTLRYLLGDEVFFHGLQYYRTLYEGRTATTNNLRDALEQYSGMDLHPFFDQWIYGEGYPTFNVQWYQGNQQLYLQVNETTSAPSKTPLFTLPVAYKIHTTAGDTTITLRQDASTQQWALPINSTVTGIDVDPDNYIINQANVTNDTIFGFSAIAAAKGLDISLYPNPASKQLWLWVRNTSVATQAQIYTSTSQLCGIINLAAGTNLLDISTLSPGVYVVLFNGGTETSVLRFMKR